LNNTAGWQMGMKVVNMSWMTSTWNCKAGKLKAGGGCFLAVFMQMCGRDAA